MSQNQYHPPESNGYRRSDQESLEITEEERRRKRMKWTIGIIAFVLFQVVQALFFILVIMKFKSPKFRIAEFEVQSLTVIQSTPSFNMSFVAPIRVKNMNWGPFKYDASTISFTYGDAPVGQVIIPKGKANIKSTKKYYTNVTLTSSALASTSNLKSDLNSGIITLNSQGQLSGKVTVMFMFKKKKISHMNCTMEIDVTRNALQSLACK